MVEKNTAKLMYDYLCPAWIHVWSITISCKILFLAKYDTFCAMFKHCNFLYYTQKVTKSGSQ